MQRCLAVATALVHAQRPGAAPAPTPKVTAVKAGVLIDPETGTAATNQVILIEGENPIPRTNVAPVVAPPAEPMLYAFDYTIAEATPVPTFVVAGAGEMRERLSARARMEATHLAAAGARCARCSTRPAPTCRASRTCSSGP